MPASQSIADRFSAPLERMRSSYAGSPLRQFMRWWGGELATLLPKSWRALFAAGQSRVLYVMAADAIELRMEESGRDALLASIPLDEGADISARVEAALGTRRTERPRWLLLPGGQVLRRRIALPAAAADRLRDVVVHEIDRQTPFRADQVAFDCRVLSIDAASKMAQVELLVLTRERLDAALAQIGPLANRLSGVDARDAEGRPLQCNLLPPERRQPRDHRAMWLHLGLAAIALIALLFALGQMLDNRRAALVKLQAQVDASHEQARQTIALSKQLEEVSAGTDFLGRKRAETPPMLAVLAEVSSRVPDNTFIERFAEQQGQIYLTGLSTDAAGLVAKLQASTMLHSPALSGSVQPDALSKRDRFTLVAELAGTRPKGTDDAPAQP